MTTAPHLINRRQFIKRTTSVLALASLPVLSMAQTGKRIRLEWQQFKLTSQYPSFLSAISRMRANTNANDRNSWQFWINVNLNYCPHSVPYFIAWHRGYIYYFERQLRTISGDSALNLPYWDYYTNPNIPSEFTDQATGNPLYQARTNTNVYNALDLAPFNSGLYNFQRNTANAFEPQLEGKPHNPVHDIIGGVMTTMRSPTDPIFYLHHCNVDRLTHAWALPDGKGIPYTANPYSSATSDPYWAGRHVYASRLTMDRSLTYDPAYLNYDYANHDVPTALPLAAAPKKDGFIKVQMQSNSHGEANGAAPEEGNFENGPPRPIAPNRRSLGSALNVDLDERSVTARVKLSANEKRQLRKAFETAGTPGSGRLGAGTVVIVFDKINVSEQGKAGGYFYNIYVNLPAGARSAQERQPFLLGTVGAFAIDAASHHGTATIEFPASEKLAEMDLSTSSDLSVSLVRINGANSPKGKVIKVGEVRVDIVAEGASPDSGVVTPKPPGGCSYNC